MTVFTADSMYSEQPVLSVFRNVHEYLEVFRSIQTQEKIDIFLICGKRYCQRIFNLYCVDKRLMILNNVWIRDNFKIADVDNILV